MLLDLLNVNGLMEVCGFSYFELVPMKLIFFFMT